MAFACMHTPRWQRPDRVARLKINPRGLLFCFCLAFSCGEKVSNDYEEKDSESDMFSEAEYCIANEVGNHSNRGTALDNRIKSGSRIFE